MPDSTSAPNGPENPSTPPGILEEARETAREGNGYNSQAVRSAIEQEFQDIFDGNRPYDWQLDVTEALILGQDCIAIAGTGSGKTMPFGMPFMHPDYRDRTVLILSPLNELEAEQVRALPPYHSFPSSYVVPQAERLKKMRLTATAVNGEVYSPDLHKVSTLFLWKAFPDVNSSAGHRVRSLSMSSHFSRNVPSSPVVLATHSIARFRQTPSRNHCRRGPLYL